LEPQLRDHSLTYPMAGTADCVKGFQAITIDSAVVRMGSG